MIKLLEALIRLLYAVLVHLEKRNVEKQRAQQERENAALADDPAGWFVDEFGVPGSSAGGDAGETGAAERHEE